MKVAIRTLLIVVKIVKDKQEGVRILWVVARAHLMVPAILEPLLTVDMIVP
jgi:hypothetical protein